MLGVVQTADGLPIYHEVFDGNTAEAKTLLPILKKVIKRFANLRRLILVADRGLPSSTVTRVTILISLNFGLKRAPTRGSSAAFDWVV